MLSKPLKHDQPAQLHVPSVGKEAEESSVKRRILEIQIFQIGPERWCSVAGRGNCGTRRDPSALPLRFRKSEGVMKKNAWEKAADCESHAQSSKDPKVQDKFRK